MIVAWNALRIEHRLNNGMGLCIRNSKTRAFSMVVASAKKIKQIKAHTVHRSIYPWIIYSLLPKMA
jgi:hypothetical protein